MRPYKRVGVACLMASGCLSSVAWSQCGTVDKVTASDAAAVDIFGYSVSVSGIYGAIGAYGNDDGGTLAGSAYIFDITDGSQLYKLNASDAAARDQFGFSVAVSGDYAVVGAPFDDTVSGTDTGSAYVFHLTDGSELFKLTAGDAAVGDRFGHSVAISGNYVVIGAHRDDDSGSGSGSAYVFDVTTGLQLFKLTASDAMSNNEFGISVSVSGDRAVIGAHLAASGALLAAGSAYVFDVTNGNQLFKLTADDPSFNAFFGKSVALSGNTAVIGADGDDGSGSDSGSAYVFDITSGSQIFKLTASDAAAVDFFGYSVSVSNGLAAVGAFNDDDAGFSSGSAYVFDTATGDLLRKLTANDASADDRFGFSVAISGNNAVVGAFNDDDFGLNSGSAYIFDFPPQDFNFDGNLDFFDLVDFLNAYLNMQPRGDYNNDGQWSFVDISRFIVDFQSGC